MSIAPRKRSHREIEDVSGLSEESESSGAHDLSADEETSEEETSDEETSEAEDTNSKEEVMEENVQTSGSEMPV